MIHKVHGPFLLNVTPVWRMSFAQSLRPRSAWKRRASAVKTLPALGICCCCIFPFNKYGSSGWDKQLMGKRNFLIVSFHSFVVIVAYIPAEGISLIQQTPAWYFSHVPYTFPNVSCFLCKTLQWNFYWHTSVDSTFLLFSPISISEMRFGIWWGHVRIKFP